MIKRRSGAKYVWGPNSRMWMVVDNGILHADGGNSPSWPRGSPKATWVRPQSVFDFVDSGKRDLKFFKGQRRCK